MKWTAVLVLVVVAIAVVAKPRGHKNRACKYDYRAATCDLSTDKMVYPLIPGQSTGTDCAPTRPSRWRTCSDKRQKGERSGRRNRACKYDYKAATCDQTTNKMVAQLIPDQSTGTDCAPTRTLSRRTCNGKTNKGRRGSRE